MNELRSIANSVLKTVLTIVLIAVAAAIVALIVGHQAHLAYWGAVAGLCVLHWIWFGLVGGPWLERLTGGDVERKRRLMTWIVATPSPFAATTKINLRYRLIDLNRTQRRYEEAVGHARALLEHPWLLREGVAADVRRQLVDCLEALGRNKEAAAEQKIVKAELKGSSGGYSGALARGKLLSKENKYAEAYDEFERLLATIEPDEKAKRPEVMLNLMLAAFNAGRPESSLGWAEAMLAAGAQDKNQAMAHRMAAVCLNNLGRLDEAERHGRLARECAVARRNLDEETECLMLLADTLRRSGRLIEAEKLCLEALALAPTRHALTGLTEVYRTMGLYEEALRRLAEAERVGTFTIPHFERRMLAAFALTRAYIEAELGRPDDAWASLSAASAELATDPKLGFECEVLAVWLLALLGRPDESTRRSQRVEQRLQDAGLARSSRLSAFSRLGAAAVARGDFARGEHDWQAYLALKPDPVNLPQAWYHLGECWLKQGDRDSAREAYREADSLGINTSYARLARERLLALDEAAAQAT